MIFLIRHGESEANVGLPTCLPECGGLTQRGQAQAEDIAHFLRGYPLDLIITSPYWRAIQTAEPTSFAFHNIPERLPVEEVQSVQEFTYLAPKRWACSTTQERLPAVVEYWQMAQPDYVDGPGAESFSAFIERVRTFWGQMREVEREYENIAVFSHEQFINAVLWLKDHNQPEASSQAMHDFRTLLDTNRIQNGTIVKLEFSYDDNSWKHEVITSHLKNYALVATH